MSGPSGVWALGDFPKVARETIAGTGDLLVEACGVHRGQRLLDVAAGAGNVALPAARAGAEVVASDITPELLAAGRMLAASEGLGIEWVEADAQALPFAADTFDLVTSAFGAIFAPDHRATAAELLRVCRPGGTIGMLNWTPEGWSGQFFARLSAFMPTPPPGFQSPALWGHEPHLRELLGDGIVDLRAQRRMVVLDRFATPADLVLFYRENFGPVIAVCSALADDPQALAALDEALIDFARRTNLAAGRGEGARYELEYLLVVARTQSDAAA